MILNSIGHLVTLGLKADEAEIYAALLSVGPGSVTDLAGTTGHEPARVAHCFEALVAVGLVSRGLGDRDSVTPIPPDLGLDLLTRRREVELTHARIAAVKAYESHRRAGVGDSDGRLIEVIGGAAVGERISQLERSARHEVRGLDSPPYYADADANDDELDNLARGVRYRAVYGKVALERPEYLAGNVVPCGKAGEEARILPDVPVKLLIIDGECAVVSPSVARSEVGAPALLIRPCSLLSALVGLFEMCWRAALPFGLDERPTTGLPVSPIERRLLGLLAAGLSDDQVARSLGVSRRTVFRYLETLLERTGAANRFQLALHAKRNAWL